MAKVLVTGATGFVGSNLCRELISSGHQVRALYRNEEKKTAVEDLKVEWVKGDLTEPASLEKACEGIETVYHIAALFREAGHADSVYHKINIEGVDNIFKAAISSGVTRLIHCSTVGVHSHISNPPADENEEARPGDIYQETKWEGEKLARSYFEEGKIRGAVIRPAMIWGPGDTRTLKLFKGVASRKFPLIGTGKTFLHWVLVTDLAKGFRLAGENSSVNNEVFILAGQENVSMRDMISTIAEEFQVKPLPFRIPAWPVQILGDIVESICIPLGIEPPIYRRRVDFFTKTRSFNWTKAREVLGYQPELSFKEEVKRIADWYKEKGWI